MATIETGLTKKLGIKRPILLAGMNVASGPELAAAVCNEGGLGSIGGFGYTPEFLQAQIDELKKGLKDKNAPFGIDLLIPQVGGSARKTNKDYTDGHLPELIDVIIKSGTKLFISAVGVPPRWAVDKLHAAGIPVMNMIGSPKHVAKAAEAGVDIVCAQGGEGGGHTGEIGSSVLIPKVVDIARKYKSPLWGDQIRVVAAGGIFDGRGLAAALAWGAEAVWVGTRFICAKESGAPSRHQQAVLKADYHDTVRTIIFSGRPLRTLKTPYIMDWEENRQAEIKQLTSQGILPVSHDLEQRAKKAGGELPMAVRLEQMPLLMGQAAGAVVEILPAAAIMDSMINEAIAIMEKNVTLIRRSKL